MGADQVPSEPEGYDKAFETIFHADPIDDAQFFSGHAYTEPQGHAEAFFRIHDYAAQRANELARRGDTFDHMPFESHCAVAEREGFVPAYEEQFVNTSYTDHAVVETLVAMFHPVDGTMLLVTSYGGQRVNSSHL